MDAKKTIAKLKGEADRTRMSVYLSQSIFNDFKQACGNVSPSRVLEELMREFVEDLKKTTTKKISKRK
jgi:hypothetical protein